MDKWRLLLYYPLGTLPALFFSMRVLVQWMQSERAATSVVSALFWRLSLAGNLFSIAHYFLQLQLPFALFQAINAVISWRNLKLLYEGRVSALEAVRALIFALCSLLFLFSLFSYFSEGEVTWTFVPLHRVQIFWGWHLVGILGQSIFASRFWLQWWLAERKGESHLSSSFWWLCIAGNFLSLLYFTRIQDSVSLLTNSFSMIPAIRNLVLLRRG